MNVVVYFVEMFCCCCVEFFGFVDVVVEVLLVFELGDEIVGVDCYFVDIIDGWWLG